jgi:hypothetical protein
MTTAVETINPAEILHFVYNRNRLWKSFAKVSSALSSFGFFFVLRNGLNNSSYWVHRTIIKIE